MNATHIEEMAKAGATALYVRLMRGDRTVVSEQSYDNLIDHCSNRYRMGELASCQNRHRCGVNDGFVAWIGSENKPLDLELGADGSLFAVGSA
jgi:hypothetical protein